MSAITVGGTAASGQQPSDAPLVLGVFDGALVRYLKGNTFGNPEISGAAADGAAVQGNPLLLAMKAGTNVKTIAGNTLGQVFVSITGKKKTYSFAYVGLSPVAAATDILNIIGSGSTEVSINRIGISGCATVANVIDVAIIKRSTANTGSTLVPLTAVPHDSINPNAAAATAVINACTVTNPTVGTSLGVVRWRKLLLGTVGGTIAPAQIEFLFGKDNGQELILHGVLESVSINLNGQTIPAGTVLDIEVEVTEL